MNKIKDLNISETDTDLNPKNELLNFVFHFFGIT